jgi:hypothetical protein
MRVLSNRIKIVNQLLQTHPSVEAAFRIVEESAENKVVYSRFDLHSVDATHGYELLLSASAPDYHTVINQMDAFKQKTFSTYISTVEISNLHPDTNGQVGFNLKMPIMISGILPETIPLDPANIVNLQAQGILPASTPKETPAPTTSPNGAATTTQKASPTTVLNINDASKAPKK